MSTLTVHWAKSVVLWVALCAALNATAQDLTNQLLNPGFEQGSDQALAGWDGYGRGYAVDRTVSHGGQQSIKCTAQGGEDGMGAVQVIRYAKPDQRPIIVGGWSKAENVYGGGDYCVYLDIFYEDGTPWWGKISGWRTGTHDWQYNARIYWPMKPVKEIQTFVFLRRATGTAWFDDLKVSREGLHLTNVTIGSDYPRSKSSLQLRAELTGKADWRCDLIAPAGKVLDTLTGTGNEILWLWQRPGKVMPSNAKFTAHTAAGETMEFVAKTDLPPPPPNPVKNGYAVWTQNSMRKVYPTAAPPPRSGPVPPVVIAVARNEREGLQIAIKPADDAPLQEVHIKVGQLTNDKGDTFPPEHVQWYIIGYIRVETPSGHPLAPSLPNWCPDVLLPAKPFEVSGGRTQTVWLNFFAAADVKPGEYRGTVTVQPANAPLTELQIALRVRRFSLPRTPRMKTAFALMEGFTRHTYGKITPELRRACLDIMLEHRLNPDDISRTEPPPLDDLLYARDRGMNTFNILNLVPEPEGKPLWTCLAPLKAYGPEFNQQLASRLDSVVAELRKHGLSDMAYFYGFDERREEYDELIKQICGFLKQRYPEVSTFTTATYMYRKRETTPPGYEDHMDWYCPLTPGYKPELSEKLRVLGKQVWWYVCCGPKHPYANFASMDYAAIEGRLLSWMTYGYKADGLLFWHVNYWQDNKIIDTSDPYLEWQATCISRMTGDGLLIYPTPQGPVSSIRLENIRDGIEDFDYLSLLAEMKGRQAAMKYFSRIIKSMTEYTRNPSELYEVREQMAEEIEKAM